MHCYSDSHDNGDCDDPNDDDDHDYDDDRTHQLLGQQQVSHDNHHQHQPQCELDKEQGKRRGEGHRIRVGD